MLHIYTRTTTTTTIRNNYSNSNSNNNINNPINNDNNDNNEVETHDHMAMVMSYSSNFLDVECLGGLEKRH